MGYIVFCRDRVIIRGGGVFILVCKQFIVFRVFELEIDCELLWVKVVLYGCKVLYVGVYYKLEEVDEQSLVELNILLFKFVYKGGIIWFIGDFNMLKYDQVRNSIDVSCRNIILYEYFIEFI